MKFSPNADTAAVLGLDAPKGGPAEMMGGKDNEGGGYDSDARRLQKALASGDGDTMYSIIKGIVMDCMENKGHHQDTSGEIDED